MDATNVSKSINVLTTSQLILSKIFANTASAYFTKTIKPKNSRLDSFLFSTLLVET